MPERAGRQLGAGSDQFLAAELAQELIKDLGIGLVVGGRAFGSRKLWPAVSPKKTVEGSVASFAASLLVGVIGARIVLTGVGSVESLLVAAVVNVLAQLGDLLESMLKRAHHATDSGWIFPGHGGVLDRTDSLVLPVVFIYYYAILSRG